jgi:hypothetical protein
MFWRICPFGGSGGTGASTRRKFNLVGSGDQFQGTLFYTYYKGKLAAEMMNDLC